MNTVVNNIRQRLSLRKPLAEALDLTSRIVDNLSLQKPPKDEAELKVFLKKELTEVKAIVPTVKDFDRDFPSLAFSIATGIGKTRLMGAIIAYFYLKKGIKHFFILAPNLTLYNKLIRDFGDVSYEKYLFKGISDFVINPPQIVTGETYNDRTPSLFSSLQINIFNIAKFNKDSKEGKKGLPRMRRLSEYIGQSYFDYLASLPDLVILMDEAHRYHADASKKAINELNPVLGFEMTATPIDEKNRPFKNIVYEYNLAQALADKKYVKDPTIAGRKNFDKKDWSAEEIENMKLVDGINVHERTKTAIELYAKQNGRHVVHPFILVACRDIAHAKAVAKKLESDTILHGRYKGKVLRIDSESKKDEEIEQQFIALESPDNQIEIVVHVNMLKEGWDVNNLYTIIPLRAADAAILIEQTIGRGLRLPYGGERTGNKDVDTLTVVAHDNFAQVISKSKDPNSVLSKLSYVEIDDEENLAGEGGKVVKTPSSVEQKYREKIQQAQTDYDKKVAERTCDAVRAVVDAIPQVAHTVQHYSDLKKPEFVKVIREKAVEDIKRKAQSSNPLFAEQEAAEQIAQLDKVIKSVIIDYEKNFIEMPRLVIEQPRTRKIFEDFDLYTERGFDLADPSYEIIRQSLATDEVDIIVGKNGFYRGKPADMLVTRLMDYDDVDYDTYADLLYKLANQAVKAICLNSPGASDDDISEKVNTYGEPLAHNIYQQMCAYSHVEKDPQPPKRVLPFSRILDQRVIVNEFGYRMVGDIPTPASWAKKYVVKGFLKSYYPEYRFDSLTEWDFAFALEHDDKVLKWLRPVPQQFNIYWADGSKRYEPDFIVETADTIYMCETKAEKDVSDEDVKAKADAARTYCAIASGYNARNSGKQWKYLIIPHTAVKRNFSFDYIIGKSNLFIS